MDFNYKKFTDVPFTEIITGKGQGNYKNGKEKGSSVSYHQNGRVEKEITFRNGKKTGFEVGYGFWRNGHLSSQSDCKDGKREGPWVRYYDDGQLQDKGDQRHGKRDRPWVIYERDGTFDMNNSGTCKNGKKISD